MPPPAFDRVFDGRFPEHIAAGWVCPCGAFGYLLQGASPEDIAGYEQGAAAHVDVCFEGGAL